MLPLAPPVYHLYTETNKICTKKRKASHKDYPIPSIENAVTSRSQREELLSQFNQKLKDMLDQLPPDYDYSFVDVRPSRFLDAHTVRKKLFLGRGIHSNVEMQTFAYLNTFPNHKRKGSEVALVNESVMA
jgi:hypothetical protein